MRVAGYVRVSSAEQVEGFSLDAQRGAITRYCAGRGWGPITWYEDAGVSGYTDDVSKRPAFARLLAEAQARAFDVVIVHKLDRFARSRLVTITELKRLSAAKVAFVSISEDMDFASPIGDVMLTVLASFAEYSSANLSAETKKGQQQRRLSGAYVGGVPWGARLNDAGQREVDPAKAASLALLLDLAARHSYNAVAGRLNERGIVAPRSRGGLWGQTGVRSVVLSGAWLLDQPPPWPERYAAARSRPRIPRVSDPRSIRLLSGLLRCQCGGVIVYSGVYTAQDGTRHYSVQCRHTTPERPNGYGCPHRKARASHYERLVTDWFLALPDPDIGAETATGSDDTRADLAQRRRRLGLALADGMITEADYRARKAALDAEEARLPLAPVVREQLATAIRDGQAAWPDPHLSERDRNTILRLLIARIIVSGREVSIEPTLGLAAVLANQATHP